MAEKTTEVGKVVQEVADTVQDQMATYFDAAKAVMEQYGGDVVDLGLNVLRIEAISELSIFIMLPVLAYGFYKAGNKIMALHKAELLKEKRYYDGWIGVVALLSWGVTASLAVSSVIGLFNIWAWVGMFYPELYAVHKFLL